MTCRLPSPLLRWPSIRTAVALGIGLRVLWLLIAAGRPSIDDCLCDPGVYLVMAQKNVDGDWFGDVLGEPTAFLSVGYPALLALGHLGTFGLLDVWRSALVVNLLASAALIVGAGRVAASLAPAGLASTAPLAAALAMALYPDAITATGLVMTELPASAVLMWTVVWALKATSRSTVIAGAVLITVAIWLRPSWMLMPLGLLVWLGLRRARPHALGAAALIIAVGVAPLYWNNTERVGAPPGITSATWINICDGADGRIGFTRRAVCDEPIEGLFAPPGSEGRSAKLSRSRALGEIADNADRWLLAVPARVALSIGRGGWGVDVAVDWSRTLGTSWRTDVVRRLSQLGFDAAVAFAAIGVVRGKARLNALLWFFAASAMLGVAITFAQARFGWPVVSTMIIPLAGCGLAWVSHRNDAPDHATPERSTAGNTAAG